MTTYEVREFDKHGCVHLADDPPEDDGRDQALELQRSYTKIDSGQVRHRYDLVLHVRDEDMTFYGMTDTEVQRLARSLSDLVGSVQPADVAEGEASPVLGPVYFSARRWADGLVPAYQEGALAAIVRKAAEHFLGELQEGAENYVLSDVSSNVQGHVWHLVDRIVEDGIIGDVKWVVDRYALGERYQCQALRVALAEKCRDVLVPMVAQRLRDEASCALQSRDWYRRQSADRFEHIQKISGRLAQATELLVQAEVALDNVSWSEHAGGLRDKIKEWVEQGRS